MRVIFSSCFIFCLFVVTANASISTFREGGVSGGGGNVIDPTPPDRYTHPDYVEHIVKNSIEGVSNYFCDTEKLYRRGLPEEDLKYKKIFDVLFDPEIDIHRIVKRNYPEIEEDGPCFDSDNKPVDGSFQLSDGKKICISAYNLAKKVNRNELAAQSIALMVHEYVELAGLSDDDAVILQKKVLQDLK